MAGDRLNSASKKIRKINPLGYRVLISIMDENDVTDGGLYLPEGAKQNLNESLLARVIEVASATDHDTDEETNISGIPMGATVLIAKSAGIKVPWDDRLRIVNSKDILAMVEEVNLL